MAAKRLGSFDSPVAEHALMDALKDRSRIVRELAGTTLAELYADRPHLEFLAAANTHGLLGEGRDLTTDPPSVTELLEYGLWRFPVFKPTEAFIESLGSDDPILRHTSAIMLGQLGDRQAVPRLIASLDDPIIPVREAAAEALGRLGDPSVIPKLLDRKDDEDGRVRRRVRAAIKMLQKNA